jgi:hypothetical protein
MKMDRRHSLLAAGRWPVNIEPQFNIAALAEEHVALNRDGLRRRILRFKRENSRGRRAAKKTSPGDVTHEPGL